jgi:hypothetical protein
MRSAIVILVALAVAASAAARNPHDPKEKLIAADNATARAIVIHRSDLVGKWKAEKPDTSPDKPCRTFDPDLSDLTITGKADSQDFSRADGVLISSQAEIYETAVQLRKGFGRYNKPKLIPCVDAVFREGAKGTTVKMLVGRMAPVPRYGDRAARFQFVWALTENGQTVKAFADIYHVAKGRKSVMVFVFSSPAQVTVEAQRDLVKRVADRL